MPRSLDEALDLALSFQRSRVLLTAFELDVFTAVGEEEVTSESVALRLGTDPRATDRLMNALCALGLLRKRGVLFSNTEVSGRHLVRGKPGYAAGLHHYIHLWRHWSTLTEAVRKGTSVTYRPLEERGGEEIRALIAAMHERASRRAPSVVALIDLSGVSEVLDVGGGSGAYAMAFVRARDGIRATIFDLPHVLPLTLDYIREEGLEDRVRLVEGDLIRDNLGEGYDLVFISAVVHIFSPTQNLDLMRKAARALNPGGRLVIQDFIMDEDRTSPPFGTLFALNMLVATEAGDTYTESEVRGWMEEAGFDNVRRTDTPWGTALMEGTKLRQ
jgi:ubiquinone/menaquinone biosynthesis C-methylase UbiE